MNNNLEKYFKQSKITPPIRQNFTVEKTLFDIVKEDDKLLTNNSIKSMLLHILMSYIVAVFRFKDNDNIKGCAYSYYVQNYQRTKDVIILKGHFICSISELKTKTNKNNPNIEFVGFGITNETLYQFLESNHHLNHKFDFMKPHILEGIKSGYIISSIIYKQILINYRNELFYNRPDLDKNEQNVTLRLIEK